MNRRIKTHMSMKLLLIMALVFYNFLDKDPNGLFLFCFLYTLLLSICVLCYQMENTKPVKEEKK